MQVIVISGKAGSGKSFLAEKLKDYLEVNYNLKGYIINFADPLKMVCEKVYHWDGNKGEYGRTLLQKVGTDIVHKQNPLTWTNIIISIIEGLYAEFDFVIVADARFLHEIRGIVEHFTREKDKVYTIKIIGKANESLTEEQKHHKSETELDDYNNFHYVFDNTDYNIYGFFYKLANLCYTIDVDDWK